MKTFISSLAIATTLLFSTSSSFAEIWPWADTLGFHTGLCEEAYHGSNLSPAGDVNGDGVLDYMVNYMIPTFDPYYGCFPSNEGFVEIHSGTGGGYPLFSFPYDFAASSYGASFGSVGDIDGDGLGDFFIAGYYEHMVGGPIDSGIVYLYAGTDGSELGQLTGYAGEFFGEKAAPLGDVNQDGHDEFLVTGVLPNQGGGFVRMISGKTLETLYELTDGSPTGFGMAVDGIGDVNQDGTPDFVVGGDDIAHVFSGADASLLFDLVSTSPWSQDLGLDVAGVGDTNGDGYPDIAVAERFTESSGCMWQASGATLFSGKDGTILHFLKICNVSLTFASTLVSWAGDVDGDGNNDVLLGNPGDTNFPGGGTYIFSGKTGEILLAKGNPDVGAALGSRVVGMGDVNNDGHSDFISAAPYLDSYGEDDVGGTYFYSGCPSYIWKLGGGYAGTNGVIPELAPPGCPMPGTEVKIKIEQALGHSEGLLVIGDDWGYNPMAFHPTLVINNIFASIPFSTSENGQWRYSIDIPEDIPVDTTVTMQAFIVDPGSDVGVSATNGSWMILRKYGQ